MIVLDTSAALDALLSRPTYARLARRLRLADEVTAPHLIDVEVLHVLRRLVRTGRITPHQAADTRLDFRDLRILRYPHTGFADRIWELRNAVSAYDAAYIALAEALGCPLVTTDARIATASGHRAEVEVYGAGD
jgi:predicted nucleic acid-binding protein